MNLKSGLVLLIALVAGVLGGTAAYQVASPASSSAESGAREPIVVKNGDRGRDRPPGFAPCKRPAVLQGGRCVTEVTKTVVVPGAAPAQPAGSAGRAPAPAPAPVPFQASGEDHEGRHHGGEGEDGHHGDDDDDDDTDDATDTATDTSHDVTDTHGDDGGDDDDGGTQTRTRTHD